MSSFTNFIQHTTESSSQWNVARKGNKTHIDQKRINSNVPLCRWHNYLCRKSQDVYKNTHTTSEFSKVSGYKVNILNSIVFISILPMNIWAPKLDITPFTIFQKRKYLYVNLINSLQDLFAENYTILMEE